VLAAGDGIFVAAALRQLFNGAAAVAAAGFFNTLTIVLANNRL
jgi:hypothetical protein